MKVFISWSKERSKRVAELFKTWLKCVIQASDPWVSTQDIESGSLWFSEINSQLAEVSIGIICLTNENKDNPWILFEAGALTKGLSTSRVIPFLVDLQPQDLRPPLSQLNGALPDRESLYKLARTINLQLKEGQLPSEVFETVFNTYWPLFEGEFNKIITSTIPTENPKPREENDILSEILTTVRGFDSRLRYVENNIISSGYRPSNGFVSTKTSVNKAVNSKKVLLSALDTKIEDIISDYIKHVGIPTSEITRSELVSVVLDKINPSSVDNIFETVEKSYFGLTGLLLAR